MNIIQNVIVWPNNAVQIHTLPHRAREYWIDKQVKPGGLFGNCRDLLLSTSIWEAGDNDSRYIRCQQQTDRLEDFNHKRLSQDHSTCKHESSVLREPPWDGGANFVILFKHPIKCWGKSPRCFFCYVLRVEMLGERKLAAPSFNK